jgi:hypothetical protein
MPAMPVDVSDAAELLQLIGGWLESDRDNLAASLARFIGSPAYGPGELRDDFARFRFLLGVTDGEGVFTRASRERTPARPVSFTRNWHGHEKKQAPDVRPARNVGDLVT